MTPAEVRAFAPLVAACVRRFAPATLPAALDLDDLEQVAWQALLNAESSFDASRGVPFDAWAWIRMRGSVLNEVERMRFGKRGDPAEVVSFDERDRGGSAELDDAHELRTVMEALDTLEPRIRFVVACAAVGRRDSEIAVSLGVSVRRVQQMKVAGRFLIRRALRIPDQVAA